MRKYYGRQEMAGIWNEKSNFYHRLLVEIAVLRARRSLGEFDHEVPDDLESKIKIDPDDIEVVESNFTDMAAFLAHVRPQFPPELQPWLHKDLSDEDVCETALSMQLRASTEVLTQGLEKLMAVIRKVALENKHVPQIGRTHGIHTKPITFGVKLAGWYDELGRHRERLSRLAIIVSRGKISGAVGMYDIDPQIERIVCERLGLDPVVSTQIISRDIIGEYMTTLGLVASSIGKFALNLRLLSQTEICEIMEPGDSGTKQTLNRLPVKNPATCENLTSLVRVIGANTQVAFENLAHCWHERSMDNSGSERLVIVESSTLADFVIDRLAMIIQDMDIFPHQMQKNLNLTGGLIFSPEAAALIAQKSGLSSEEVQAAVRIVAQKSWTEETSFTENLLSDPSIGKYVTWLEIQTCFKLESKLRYVDLIFERVFGNNP